jgi:hypothetical protein
MQQRPADDLRDGEGDGSRYSGEQSGCHRSSMAAVVAIRLSFAVLVEGTAEEGYARLDAGAVGGSFVVGSDMAPDRPSGRRSSLEAHPRGVRMTS